MVGFPKTLKTRADIVNTYKLTLKGKLKKKDWLAAIEKLENQNYSNCPIVELSDDRKTAKLYFCNEAQVGQILKAGTKTPTIKAIETIEEVVEEATETTEEKTANYTVLTLSAALAAGTTEIGIPVTPSMYERYNITEAELATMKGEIEAL